MADQYPANYAGIHARETAIEDARSIKDDLNLTWSQFLRRATFELDANDE